MRAENQPDPLANPIWSALTTRQQNWVETQTEAVSLARRFPPQITALSGFQQHNSEAYNALASQAAPGELAFLFLDTLPAPTAAWELLRHLPLLQMVHENVHENGAPAPSAAPEFLELGAYELSREDAPEMLALAELTKPGPFAIRTHELGTYLGIRREGRLAAMAGERMRLPGYTELSAVCTHPEHTGLGYARLLMLELMRRIYLRGETPMLHVRGTNDRAIAIYQRMGFKQSRTFELAVLRKLA